MHKYLIDLLCCPNCHGTLEWKIEEEIGNDYIQSATSKCSACKRKYPVKKGIGLFVNDGERDPWKVINQQLSEFMQTKDGEEFLAIPFEELGPADRLFQSYMLEINGDFENSQKAESSAMLEIYSEDYKKCWNTQIQHIARAIISSQSEDDPVVDLASGRGILAKSIALATRAPVVVTDISPTILERDKRLFDMNNINDKVDFLAFDLQFMPFKSSSITTLTTNLGFQNVSEKYVQVDAIFSEVKRVLSGIFLGVSNFYDPRDSGNGSKISELGLNWSFYKNDFLRRFRSNGFEVKVENVCVGKNEPTPVGDYIKETSIDALPIESTLTEWCTVVAGNQHGKRL